MTQSFIYSPEIWPSVIMIMVLLILSIYSWRRREIPGALPFSIACLIAVLLSLTKAMEAISLNFEDKLFWTNLEYALLIPNITAITFFILDYANPKKWRNKRYFLLFSIVPIIGPLLQLTNRYHHLVFSKYIFGEIITPVFGPAGWMFLAYALVLTLINFIVFTNLFLRSTQHRWPVAIMLIAQIIGRVIFLMTLFGQVPKTFSFTETTFPFIAYAIALFGFRIFDPISMAHQVAIDQLQVGILVLDSQNRIVSINPYAKQIFDLEENQIKGHFLSELNPGLSGVFFQLSSAQGNEFSFFVKGKLHHFLVNNSQLKDWRGLEVGRLLMLMDITSQKRTNEIIIDQQRSLAILQERELLAHELHDNTGQVLGYLRMESQALQKLIKDGNFQKASDQLNKMAKEIQHAHADLRDGIMSLRTEKALSNTFINSLDQYLRGFSENVGIHTDLTISSDISESDFPPGVAVQLIRVIQEVLTNVYKHAQAKNVKITFSSLDEQAIISLKDDGTGFDQSLKNESGHFGIVFMQERMSQIGGSIEIRSEFGKGTEVILTIPRLRNGELE